MNYLKHYNILINKSKNRTLQGYIERHHIIPKCLGGNDDTDNIAFLTAREHFIAHLLLLKIYPNQYGLIKAVNIMCVENSYQNRSINRMYGWLKEKFSLEMSRSQTGQNNSQFGTMWITNMNDRKSIKIPKTNTIPDGWVKGRNKWNKSDSNDISKNLKVEKYEKLKKETFELFIKYLNSDYSSLNRFADECYDKSLVSLTKRFKKYIDGYSELSLQGAQYTKQKFIEKYL